MLGPSRPFAASNLNALLIGPTFAVLEVNVAVTSTPGFEVIVIVAALAVRRERAKNTPGRRDVVFMRKPYSLLPGDAMEI